MKCEELVSVIIPVYNIEGYLPKCLETIAAQTYKNLEIILVDDGSSDSSGQICEEFAKVDSRAIVIHQQNMGLWAARNTGKKAAKGDYLMFIDGDDYMNLDTIRIAHNAINSNGGYDLAIYRYKKTDNLNEIIEEEGHNELRELTSNDLFEELCFRRNWIIFECQWNKLYRRNVVEGIWHKQYERSQDVDFNIQVYLKVERAVWILRELYYYVQRQSSLVHQSESRDMMFECRTKLFHHNYMELSPDKEKYGAYLLRALYKNMIHYKMRKLRTSNQAEAFQRCKEYERDTREAYWNSHFTPLYEKAIITFLLRTPRLARLLYKATNKW
jgi:glycosyltransferase involved in cell wall biosynthesis